MLILHLRRQHGQSAAHIAIGCLRIEDEVSTDAIRRARERLTSITVEFALPTVKLNLPFLTDKGRLGRIEIGSYPGFKFTRETELPEGALSVLILKN